MGAGTGNNTISVAMTFNDSVVAAVNNTSASSAAGSLNLTGTIGGAGGFTKNGDGLATFGTGAKTYTGATVLNGGRMRMSLAAAPTATSSLTINSGGQLTLIAAGSFTFGAGPLNLNGAGPTTGPFAAFPGAIRNDTGLAVTINNSVVLQSDTLIHVQGSAGGSTTFASGVSGAGKLTLTGTPHDANLGMLALNAANSYLGGTVVDGGTLSVSGAAATLGAGNVAVNSANLAFTGSSAKLSLATGVADAIADTATLSLAGGNVGGVADDGYADLGAGINEIVAALILGGVGQAPGTYGSTSSGATFQNNEYFAGTGIITVIPEPGAVAMLLMAAGACFGLRRFRSRN
jgi:autotransporter-associated beta strand protein